MGTFSATFKTPGNRTLTATDTTTPSITGTSSVIADARLGGHRHYAHGQRLHGRLQQAVCIGTPGAGILNLYDAVGAFGVSDVTLARNAIQTITFNSFANNSTFTLAFLGATTGPITYVNTSAATLQTNIQNASTLWPRVGVGNSLVTALNSTSVSVMFQGTLGFKVVAGLAASPAAVTVATTTIGSNNLRGSLLLDADNQGMTFVLSGTGTAGVLAADVYQVTIRSATNAFKDQLGSLLDGNNDGVPGDDFVTTFTVAATPTVILSIPDFARGPDSIYNVRVPNNAGEEVQTITFSGHRQRQHVHLVVQWRHHWANHLQHRGGDIAEQHSGCAGCAAQHQQLATSRHAEHVDQRDERHGAIPEHDGRLQPTAVGHDDADCVDFHHDTGLQHGHSCDAQRGDRRNRP